MMKATPARTMIAPALNCDRRSLGHIRRTRRRRLMPPIFQCSVTGDRTEPEQHMTTDDARAIPTPTASPGMELFDSW